MSLLQPWLEIVAELAKRRTSGDEPAFARAVHAVHDVAQFVASRPRQAGLSAWLSMFDLCLQQGEHQPQSGPYLRVRPLQSGQVEFRYFDTLVADRQWTRTVEPFQAVDRIARFLGQVRWVSDPSPPAGEGGGRRLPDEGSR